MQKVKATSFLTEDPTLKEIPILTADECPIFVNSVLYRAKWSSGYNFKGDASASIEALRVFHVNNSARQFRVRCHLGCEEVFKVADGCSSEKLFGQKDNAIAHLEKMANKDLEKCNEQIKKVEKTKANIASELTLAHRQKIKLPKEIRA